MSAINFKASIKNVESKSMANSNYYYCLYENLISKLIEDVDDKCEYSIFKFSNLNLI